MSDSVQLHELASLFPDQAAAEYAALRASIEAHGYDPAWPILRWRGQVIDGRHRLRACRELGVRPVYHDLFGRGEPRTGWEAWGYEAGGSALSRRFSGAPRHSGPL